MSSEPTKKPRPRHGRGGGGAQRHQCISMKRMCICIIAHLERSEPPLSRLLVMPRLPDAHGRSVRLDLIDVASLDPDRLTLKTTISSEQPNALSVFMTYIQFRTLAGQVPYLSRRRFQGRVRAAGRMDSRSWQSGIPRRIQPTPRCSHRPSSPRKVGESRRR